jgi:acid phosphatase
VVKRFTWISLLLLGTAFGVLYALNELQLPRVISPRKIPEFGISARDPDRPSVKFAALGDVGSGTQGQVRVADAMAETAADAGLDCVLLLGDNFYTRADDTTTEALWRDRFEDIYHHAGLQVPFHPVASASSSGALSAEAQVDYTREGGRWQMPALYYSVRYEVEGEVSVEFFAVHTKTIYRELPGAEEQLAWLREALASSTADWKIAFGHHPISSTGKHGGSRVLSRRLLPLLAEYDVALYLSAHDHHLAVMKPIDDVHLVVSGGGGKNPRDVSWTDEVIYAQAGFGFNWIEALRDELIVEFFATDDEVLYVHRIKRPVP